MHHRHQQSTSLSRPQSLSSIFNESLFLFSNSINSSIQTTIMRSRSASHNRLQSNRPSRQPRQPRKPIGILYLLIYLIIFEEIVSFCQAKDYYEVLGVSRDADSSTIKRAFRKLAVKYHPGMLTTTTISSFHIFSSHIH